MFKREDYVLIPDSIDFQLVENKYLFRDYTLAAILDSSESSMHIVLSFLRAMFRRNNFFRRLQCLLVLATPTQAELHKSLVLALKEIRKGKNTVKIHKESSGRLIIVRRGYLELAVEVGVELMCKGVTFDFVHDVMQHLNVSDNSQSLTVLTKTGEVYRIKKEDNSFLLNWKKEFTRYYIREVGVTNKNEKTYSFTATMPAQSNIVDVAHMVINDKSRCKEAPSYYF